MSNLKPSRPRGVTIVGYLFYVGGILGLIVGIFLFISIVALLGIATTLGEGLEFIPITKNSDLTLLLSFYIGIGVVFVIIGPLYIKVGRGLLKLKPGTRKTALILVVIAVVIDMVFIAAVATFDPSKAAKNILFDMIEVLIAVALNIIIIRYLQKPTIKQYFANDKLD